MKHLMRKYWIISIVSTLGLVLFQLISLIGPGASADVAAKKQTNKKQLSVSERITVHAAGRGNPWINLSDGRDLPTAYSRMARLDQFGAAGLEQALEQNRAQPLALASGDFDEDGVPDLIAGYAGPGGGILSLHRGNIDSIFPNSPEAQQRKANGTFTDSPFLSPATVFDLPQPPEFLGAGDFDADGHMDVVAAARGGTALYLLAGDGHGGLKPAQPILLPGQVTALVVGEINRADGLADVAVGIVGFDGPKVLVFEGSEGALRAEPEVFALSSQATALALGQLDGDYAMDLAVAAGNELLIVRGRDRKLSLDETRRAEVSKAKISRRVFPSPILSVAVGNFTGESRTDLAVLLQGGRLQLLERAGKAARRGKGKASWQESGTADVSLSARLLVPARVSTQPTDDLLVVDSVGHQLQIVMDDRAAVAETGRRVAASLDTEGEPVAVLPMRMNGDALSDLVIIKSGQVAPAVVTTQAAITFTVTNTNDSGAGSLRQAILDANANPGLDAIAFNIGTGVQTITPASALPGITDPVVIDGTTQPGFSGSPIIELNGTNLVAASGLEIDAGSSTVKGLVINRFTSVGIGLGTNGNNKIEGNFIGTDVTGTTKLGNFVSVGIGANNTIGGTTSGARNIISGNLYGIDIGGTNNLVQGNFIGTNATGTAALGNSSPNSSIGVSIDIGSNNTIGGMTAGARNVISGNVEGVAMSPSAAGNLVQGNFIGTDMNGSTALSNSVGVFVGAASNTIGGTTAGGRNVISGNTQDGIFIIGTNNLVQGNFIGTNFDGTAKLGNSGNGVFISDVPNNTIGGTVAGARNIISGNKGNGVLIFVLGATGNLVQGNFIGTDVTGTAKLGNAGDGVFITSTSNNTIGGTTAGAGNIISGNSGNGVRIDNGSTGNLVQGNFIGTNVNGAAALGNSNGVFIDGATSNTIGGTDAGARNIISGNSVGVLISGNFATGNLVQGNFIGTDITGTAKLGNSFVGVLLVDAPNNTIGGTVAGARNIISGNTQGILIENAGSTGNLVQGNFIGTDVTGTTALGNLNGVFIFNASSNTIGGTTAGARNIISGNSGNGVLIQQVGSTGNMVQGNFIGTNAAGTAALGNNINGVLIDFSASNNSIGGTAEGAGNRIAFNGSNGVAVGSSTGNAILSNATFSNASLGIDLGTDGVTPNDPGDGDTGSNNLQNFPVLASAISTGGNTTIQGALNSTANTQFTIEFFSNTVCDSSGNGEGEIFISRTTATSDGSGNTSFTVTVTGTAPPGQFITATATDPSNNTSEFSACVQVISLAPTITGFSPTSGVVGTSVTITGTNLANATSVKFGGVSATIDSNTDTQIVATVPLDAINGKISVTTPNGAIASTDDFTVLPKIDNFTPASGTAGTAGITISGSGFFGTIDLKFNGVSATFNVVSANSITATVPFGATTGQISVTASGTTATSAANFTVLPKIDSFTPTSGSAGTSVTLTGSAFTGATAVTFNGVGATFSNVSYSSITATVPVSATTGKISVTTPNGTATSAGNFTIAAGIGSFTPTSGPVGTNVTISGTGFTGATSVKFNSVSAIFKVVSTNTITTTVPAGATTGKITVTTPGGTFTSATDFLVSPNITGLSPISGKIGTLVTISGSAFSGATVVSFNGVNATNFTVISATSIRAVVPLGATTGKISVTTPSGIGTSAINFTVLSGISSFSPASGPVGTQVTISGSGFSGATTVKFGSVSASFTPDPNKPDSQITATVPAGATTGLIGVTTPAGTFTSLTSFLVSPTVDSFTPTSGTAGTAVTITGTTFVGVTAVKFGGVGTSFTVLSSTSIRTTVPVGAITGPISVTTAAGTGTSTSPFTVLPKITSFTPTSGPAGTSVTISGSSFSGTTAVKFNGVTANFIVLLSTSIRAVVPFGATTGPISVTTPGGTDKSATVFTVSAKITSFTPASGPVGTQVTISGSGFSGATAVKFGGVSASFTPDPNKPDSQITATVPAGATTGLIGVTTPAGTFTSLTSFLVSPTVDSFTPTSGTAGTAVTITGTTFVGVTAVKFGGAGTTFIVLSSTSIRTTVPVGAITGKISVTTTGGTGTSVNDFLVMPKITSFTPISGKIGASVTISGSGFTGATAVAFNGVSAIVFKVVSANTITATVPLGAITGPISVTTPTGNAQSATNFSVLPGISSFTPISGPVGTSVTIFGSGFTGATAVKFGGVSATPTSSSDSSVTAIVPDGAITGLITVVTPAGTFTSTTNFSVMPTVSSFTPTSGLAGTSVTITGKSFNGVTSVKFGGAVAAFTVLSPTSIKATVPLSAATGPISVATAGGTSVNNPNFIVLPKITSFSPISGKVGTVVTITGSGLLGATVKFNGTSATINSGSATSISAIVPVGATTGPISVTTPTNDTTNSTGNFTVLP